jgi:hypothetical protein
MDFLIDNSPDYLLDVSKPEFACEYLTCGGFGSYCRVVCEDVNCWNVSCGTLYIPE